MNLESAEPNYLLALGGGVAYFLLGWLWYSVLFQKAWMAASGRTAEDMQGGPMAMMALTFVAGIVTAIVVAYTYEWAAGDGLVDGLVIGATIGVGVIAMEGLKAVVYDKHSWPLYAINNGYAVVGVVLAGGIYGAFA